MWKFSHWQPTKFFIVACALLLTKNQYSVYACNALQRCQAWNSLSGVFNLVTNWLLTLVGRTGRKKLLWYDSFTVSCSSNANKMSAVFLLILSHRFRLQFCVHASLAATGRMRTIWTVRFFLDRKKFPIVVIRTKELRVSHISSSFILFSFFIVSSSTLVIIVTLLS